MKAPGLIDGILAAVLIAIGVGFTVATNNCMPTSCNCASPPRTPSNTLVPAWFNCS